MTVNRSSIINSLAVFLTIIIFDRIWGIAILYILERERERERIINK